MSNFYDENTLESRRNLCSLIEKRSLDIHKNFLASFREVKESLDEIVFEFDSMNSSVKRMRDTIERTQSQTYELINQTNKLQDEKNKVSLQLDIANKFLGHFQLSQADHQILYGKTRDEKITPDFFRVLDQVQKIHADCRVLMQNGYESLASDIMEEMTLHQEGGLERLYRWTQSHCRNIDTTSEVTSLVIEAIQRLQDRPVLFKYVIDEYATNRRSMLMKLFIEALTIGGNGSKPIEMHVTDAKRYIGDIFAWLHQAIHGERESLMILLRSCDKIDITDIVNATMTSITDGVNHPLKVRIDAVLNSSIDTITLYSIANLIRFYYNIITSMVKEGQLEQCLMEVQNMSETYYLNSLTQQVRDVLAHHNDLQQADLSPPASVKKLLTMLKELLSVANMVEGRQQDIQKIVSSVVDPLMQSMTEQASHLPAIDMAVFFLNVLYEIIGTLGVYEFIEERLEKMNGSCEAQIETLTSEQASSIVAHLNLGPIYTVLQSKETKLDIHHLKLCMVS